MEHKELKAPKDAGLTVPKGYKIAEATADLPLTEKEIDSIDHLRKLAGIDWFCKFTATNPKTKAQRTGFLVIGLDEDGAKFRDTNYTDIIWDLSIQVAGTDCKDFCVGPGTRYNLSMADMMKLRWIYKQSCDRATGVSKRRILQCCSMATQILATPRCSDKIIENCKYRITREKIERRGDKEDEV